MYPAFAVFATPRPKPRTVAIKINFFFILYSFRIIVYIEGNERDLFLFQKKIIFFNIILNYI